MRKIIFNYTSNDKARRLVVCRDLPYGEQILYAMLYLHAARVISLDNVLSITEETVSA